MKYKKWQVLEADESTVSSICENFKIPRVMAKLLVIRGITTFEQVNKFFSDDVSALYSPFLLKSMDKAVERVLKAREGKERVVVYGDYDVDGITSTSILYSFLDEIGVDVDYYIPNRFEEGYGINADALRALRAEGFDLLISVDTGISAIKQVDVANELGLDIIITDHHECKEVLPDAVAVINPKRADCDYPFKQLAGVGVTFKLISALADSIDDEIDVYKYMEIVAIGTIADLVKLESENRLFVKLAFRTMEESSNFGIQALFDVAGLRGRKMSAGLVGFQIAPRLNASGRLKSAKMGVELFLSNNYDRAYKMAKELDEVNADRRKIEKDIYDEAVQMIEDSAELSTSDILVVAGEGWNKGVVGIVASRLVEKYYKPTIVLSIDGESASGSARSIDGFSIYDALNSVSDIFDKFGGHTMAAGMSLSAARIDELRTRLSDYAIKALDADILTPKVYIDDMIDIADITVEYIDMIRRLEPFGIGNREPVFAIKGRLSGVRYMGEENKHIRLNVDSLSVVGFNMSEYANGVSLGQEVYVAGSLNNNEWRGSITPNMYMKHLKVDDYVLDSIKEAIHYHMNVDYLDVEPSFHINRQKCGEFYKILRNLSKNQVKRLYFTKLVYEYKTDLKEALLMLAVFAELGLLDYDLHDLYFNFDLFADKQVELMASKLYNYYLGQ